MKKFKYPFMNPALSVKKRVADLVSRLSLSEKIGLLPCKQQAVERLGVDACHFGTEVARGYISREAGEFSTVFPQPIGLAATFNPELMYELGEIAGIEARIYHDKSLFECGIQKLMVWGPTVDLCRDPRWGRNEESYGEDPFLTGQMSVAYTKGMSGNHSRYLRVLSGLKHFCCNNHEEDRNRDSANVDTRLLREYYYAAFEPAIRKKGAYSVMAAYNELSGVPAMINHDIQKVCKKEWDMLFAVTDGGDFSQNVTAHKYGASHAETLSLALKAGNCIMTDAESTVIAAAKDALKLGLISEPELDTAISEVLTGRFMLGEFDPPEKNPYHDTPEYMLNCDEFKETNSRAARECITLLKNDRRSSAGKSAEPILPIRDDGNIKVAVVGLLAENNFKDWYTGMSSYNTTILSGLRKALGEDRVTYHDGCDIVAIKSMLNGKYLQVKEGGFVYADSDEITKSCKFKKIDLDGQAIYISEANGKLLKLEEADRGEIDHNAPTGYVNAIGNDTFEWFGRMIIRPDGQGFKSWRNKDISVDEDGRLCEAEGCGITQYKQFCEVIVEDGAKESAKLAEEADYIIVCCGNDPMVPARECFDRKLLNLPYKQICLIDETLKANQNAILTITSSYPYTITQTPPAIIHTAHGGPESGDAMADVLLGKYNPAGRLPQTWYKSERDLPDIRNYDIAATGATYLYFEGEELYPFGHGLSYSCFEYSDFSVKDTESGDIEVNLKVKNTSDIYGEEVIQIYFTALNPRVKRPKKQLCEFIRQGFKPNQTIEISLAFDLERLRFWDVTRNKFAVESGAYKFYAASSSRDVRCTATVQILGEKIPPRNMSRVTPAVNYDEKRGVALRYAPNLERHYVHAPNWTWSSALDFYDVELSGVTGVEVAASIDVNEGKIGVFVKDKKVGEIDIPAASCPTDFKRRSCRFNALPLKTRGKLTLKPSENVNMLDVKLLEN
jgi:beta-glucosidase